MPWPRCPYPNHTTLPLLTVVGLALAFAVPSFAQQPSSVSPQQQNTTMAESAQQTPADVGILVNPMSATTARVGLGYSGRVAHRRVRADIAGLERLGWRIVGPVQIADLSNHPEDLRRFPSATAAQFTVGNAPQVSAGGPEVWPYLQAFQRWHSVEVIFALDSRAAAREGQSFSSDALTVFRVLGDGVYRYEALIRAHQGWLPKPQFGAAITPVRPVSPPATAPTKSAVSSQTLPALLLLAGGVLTCVGAALLVTRRKAARASTRVLYR